MTAAKTPPEYVSTMTLPELLGRIEWYVRNDRRALLLSLCAGEIPARLRLVEKRERALMSELGALRMLYKAISRARDYNSKPGINFTPSIRRALEDVDGVRAALAAADEGEAMR